MRLISITSSPVFALFYETLNGIITIRAYKAEHRLQDHNFKLLDANLRPFLLRVLCNCWLGVRLDIVGLTLIILTSLFVVLSKDRDSSKGQESFVALAGLALSLSMSIPGVLKAFVTANCELENQMVAVERISSYSSMPKVYFYACYFL